MPEFADAPGYDSQGPDDGPRPGRLGAWRAEIAQARMRTHALRQTQFGDATSDAGLIRFVRELQLTYEELTVAEEELRAQNDELIAARSIIDTERLRYRELFEQAPIPYVITDEAGVIRSANLAASRLVKCPIEFLPNKPLVVFTRGASRRRLRTLLRSLDTRGNHVTARFNLVTRRGAVIPVEATANVSRGRDDGIQDVRWLFVDQRPRRRLERARRVRTTDLEALVAERTSELEHSQRVKGQLVAVVSHELRTPLAAIGGYTELLTLGLRGPLNDAQRADLERIHRAYEHMARVVDDLLTFSRITADQPMLDMQDTVLLDELRAVTDLITHRATERDVTFSVTEPPSDLLVHADPERLRQILLNLIGNAVKYTARAGSVTVRAETNDRDVLIEVRDDGPGIPPAHRESIFEPFVRLDRDKLSPGTGLGLAISRRMARAMNGDVTIASDATVGSCFVLRLPRSTRLAGEPTG